MHAAIPTKYNHVQFRSRLEARWAAFFDLAGWEWHYEPVDMNGWIPDFVLLGKQGNQIYVEVKPIFWRVTSLNIIDYSPIYSSELAKVRGARVDRSDDILILGANILTSRSTWSVDHCILGLFCDKRMEALLCINSIRELDLTSDDDICRLRISGETHNPRSGRNSSDCIVDRLWAEAGNAVQWRRPRGAAHA